MTQFMVSLLSLIVFAFFFASAVTWLELRKRVTVVKQAAAAGGTEMLQLHRRFLSDELTRATMNGWEQYQRAMINAIINVDTILHELEGVKQ